MSQASIVITDMDKSPELKKALERIGTIAIGDLIEIIRLHSVLQEHGGTCPASVLLDQPVKITENLSFYLPTIGSTEVVKRVSKWFEEDDPVMEWLLAYCVAYSRDAELLGLLSDPVIARDTLTLWAQSVLLITQEELLVAVQSAYAGFPDTFISDDDKNSFRALYEVSEMAKEYGGTIGYWMWNVPTQQVVWISRESGDAHAHGVTPGVLHAAKAFAQFRRRLIDANTEASPDVS